MPRSDLEGKPAAATGIVYSPLGNRGIEYSPSEFVRAFHDCDVARFLTVISAAAMLAPLGSLTMPSRRAVECRAGNGRQQRATHNMVNFRTFPPKKRVLEGILSLIRHGYSNGHPVTWG